MICYRSTVKQQGGEDYSATYTASVNGVLQKGSCCNRFHGQTAFNSPVIIGNNIKNCYAMFYSCSSFNQNIIIPNSVNDCTMMFKECTSLNQSITIPDSVDNCVQMFYNCCNLESNIYFNGNVYRELNLTYAFMSTQSHRINIFFNIALNNVFNSARIAVYTIPTWTTMTNGFYNTTYNLYCYYNYSG